MTNQEVFDNLGQLGSVVMLASMVAAVDGSIEESELEAVGNSFAQFVSDEADNLDNFKKIWGNVLQAHQDLGDFQGKLEFAVNVLKHFKEIFDEDTRRAMLVEFSKVAMADGELHDQEAQLLGLYTKFLM